MRNFKIVVHLLKGQIKSSFLRKRVLAGYLIGMVLSAVGAEYYNRFLGTHSANMWEAYVMMPNWISTMLFFGLLVVLSDAPFVHTDSFQVLHRAKRRNWYRAMWLYVVVQSFLYYAGTVLISVIVTIKRSYWQNVWSLALQKYAGKDSVVSRIIAPDPELLERFSPTEAMLHTYLLFVLMSIVFGSMLFTLNLYTYQAIGIVIVGVIYAVSGVYWSGELLNKLYPWFLVSNRLLENHVGEHALTMRHSYLFYLSSILVIYLIGTRIVKHADFQLTESEE